MWLHTDSQNHTHVSFFLTAFAQQDIHSRPDLAHLYWQISDARIALLQAVYDAHAERIISMYTSLEAHNTPGPHLPQLHERALKHHLFLLIAAGNKPDVLTSRKRTAVKADVSAMARQLLKSSFMSDRVFGECERGRSE